MTKEEIKKAFQWGKEAIKEYHDNGEKAPAYLYDRLAELMEMYMEV